MKKRCHQCGVIRSSKDLVSLGDGKFLCFSCWNEENRDKAQKEEEK
jgi:formylmethanofuran dehydrogenase subunit E